jgi:hypothetical protein
MADNMDLRQEVREQRHVLSAIVSNPAHSQLMGIDQDELKQQCRMDPDGNISIFDAIVWRDGCSLDNARKKFYRWNTSVEETGEEPSSPDMSCSELSLNLTVSKHKFGSDPVPTPVAPFHEVLRLLAIIPGPGAARVRAQQAELSTRAMAGDWDLEQAIQGRRQALPAAAQELFMVGLESSSDAKRMRDEQHEQETQVPKRPRLCYSGEELVEFVKDLWPIGAPNPVMLLQMWEQSDGTHEDFMAKFIKHCEVFAHFSPRCCFFVSVLVIISFWCAAAADEFSAIRRGSTPSRPKDCG